MTDIHKDDLVKEVVIIGGGTAGWLTACHLAKKHGSNTPQGLRVTLIESPNIPTIGVGEGTVPSILESLRYFGISETDIIRECDATFKQSIKFVNWMKPKGNSHNNYYHHPFDYIDSNQFDLTPYWLNGQFEGHSYTDTIGIQSYVSDLHLAPKLMTHEEYAGINGYAYHLDAAKFSQLLTRHAVEKLGVKHVLAEVKDIRLTDCGAIDSVVTDNQGEFFADLFVDCTGFSSLLLGQTLGVNFISKNDVLFADHALAIQVPYTDPNQTIPSYTISTAQEAGWIWDIGLSERRGTGYVYSEKYSSHARAEQVFRDYLRQSIGDKVDELPCRRIEMNVGYREKFWVKNCVAIGLSQGFVEPLEATGLLIFDDTAKMLAELLPSKMSTMPIIAERFNKSGRYQWDRVIDFIKLHYYLSDRDDTPFWRDNRSQESTPQKLLDNLALWRERPPSDYDFITKQEVFYRTNYLYVLYGMAFNTDISAIAYRYTEQGKAEQKHSLILQQKAKVQGMLLPHRELLQRIKQYGLQKI
ncbi:tryptophan halogenase family protein [Thalassotalea sp. ND16A]|uniref:tryptophan halogenase family protein n=1 Tax=Thalassotalea sp. ND16A TaxID=1535422 RepID=UPI00051A60ED|nr:tryptophan halogenase family protein [Thalassotalea sp. ND16A]KGJ92115.1 hypothetical protein ND16A_1751 [Thalassotalea sp. ND16A]